MARYNIMVVDDAPNCAYDVFSISEELFQALFPTPGQNIEFIEDVDDRIPEAELNRLAQGMWDHPVEKHAVSGMHGILFYGLRDEKKQFYPTKRDSDLDAGGRAWRHREVTSEH